MIQRSTKGASKQRRDQINQEVNEIKDLLPVTNNIRVRLSQLQVLSLCNSYINKSNRFNSAGVNTDNEDNLVSFDFTQALPGFLLAITTEGRLLYISENVTEYLGHSMVELMTQVETIYDVIDESGQQVLRDFLIGSKIKWNEVRNEDKVNCNEIKNRSEDELQFICHMNLCQIFRRQNTFDRQKPMRVRGRLLKIAESSLTGGSGLNLAEPILVARCTPVLSSHVTDQLTMIDTLMFDTRHSLDMKFTDVSEIAEYHLGHSREELIHRSWYHVIHQDHIEEFTHRHIQLVHSGLDSIQSIVLKVQTNQGYFIWLHVIMRLVSSDVAEIGSDNSSLEIHCINHVLDEKEAYETINRERLEQRMSPKSLTQYDTAILPIQYTTEMICEDKRADNSMKSKASPPHSSYTHKELMERIRNKAQTKHMNKKARLISGCSSSASDFSEESSIICDDLSSSDDGCSLSPPSLINSDHFNQQGTNRFYLQGHTKVAMSTILDDNKGADNRSYYIKPPGSSGSDTPPYSPSSTSSYLEETSLNQMDESSFFDTVCPTVNSGKGMQHSLGGQGVYGQLPELDQGLVEHYLQDVECSVDFHQIAERYAEGKIYLESQPTQKNKAYNYFVDSIQNRRQNNFYDPAAKLASSEREDEHVFAQRLDLCEEMSVEELIAGPLFLEAIELLSSDHV